MQQEFFNILPLWISSVVPALQPVRDLIFVEGMGVMKVDAAQTDRAKLKVISTQIIYKLTLMKTFLANAFTFVRLAPVQEFHLEQHNTNAPRPFLLTMK